MFWYQFLNTITEMLKKNLCMIGNYFFGNENEKNCDFIPYVN